MISLQFTCTKIWWVYISNVNYSYIEWKINDRPLLRSSCCYAEFYHHKNYVKHWKNISEHNLLSVFILHWRTQIIHILNLYLMPIPKYYSRIIYNVETSIFTMILFFVYTHGTLRFTLVKILFSSFYNFIASTQVIKCIWWISTNHD